MKRRPVKLCLGAFLFVLAGCAWVAWADWYGDRAEMYALYDRVEVGARLAEAEAGVGIPQGYIEYDHTNVPEVVAEVAPDSKWDRHAHMNYYPGRRYVLVIHYSYSADRKVVTGKRLLRTSRSTQWLERLAQGHWD